MNYKFEELLIWQAKLAKQITNIQEEIKKLESEERMLSQDCVKSLAQFYLGLNEEHQKVEKKLSTVQAALAQKQLKLADLQNELESKIGEIIRWYNKLKEEKMKV